MKFLAREQALLQLFQIEVTPPPPPIPKRAFLQAVKFQHQFIVFILLCRIVQEIEAVLGCRQIVEYKDLGNFQFLGKSLKEGLRLHPPVSSICRITTRGENIGGYFIPFGTSVSINSFIFHRLSEAWQEPEKFNPERFSPEVKSPIQQSVFFPFSFGPRNCIGQTFAQFAARVIMARLLQEFELTLLPGQNELKYEERLTLRPKGGVLCSIKRRGENQKWRI